MQIQVSGETERMIQAALASGRFASAEEFIAAMARDYRPTDDLQVMPKHIELETLAAAQGVGPIVDFRSLKASFWQDNEPTDQFINDIRRVREHDVPRIR